MSGPLMFDGMGASVVPGLPSLDSFGLDGWPACQVIRDTSQPDDGTVGLILLLGGEGATLSRDAITHAVAALDRGEGVAVHGRDDVATLDAAAALFLLVGGGHA